MFLTKTAIITKKNLSFERILIYFILMSGISLSLIQFLYNRSLWLDESMLAINIISRDAVDLLKPLGYLQVAPILFLQIEKFFSLMLVDSDYALRVFPLVSFWISLLLFYRIVKIIFKDDFTVIFALVVFAFNSILIYYSNEVKQYMIDVLVITVIYYLLLRNFNKPLIRYLFLSAIGIISFFLSNITPIIILTVGIYLILNENLAKRNVRLYIIFLFLSWLISFSLYYFLFIWDHPAKDNMISYWSHRNAFLTINPFSSDFYIFIAEAVIMIFFVLIKFQKIFSVLIGILVSIGIGRLLYSHKLNLLLLTILPIIIHLVLSSIKLYPFELRLILYLAPIFTILSAAGFKYLKDITITKQNVKWLKLTMFIMSFALFCDLLIKLPMQRSELKKSISYMDEHSRNNDGLFIYYGASVAYNYYDMREYTLKNTESTIFGTWEGGISNNDIDLFKNTVGRNWILFSEMRGGDELQTLNILDSLQYKRIKYQKSFGSSAYLYNFSSN